MGINDLTEESHLARVIFDIFPDCGQNDAVRLARAIATLITIKNGEAEDKPEAPTVPAGWTPASEPPDDDRNIQIMLRDGKTCYGYGYGDSGTRQWRWLSDNFSELMRAHSYAVGSSGIANILCWRELPLPAPKPLAVGDIVRLKVTIVDKRPDGRLIASFGDGTIYEFKAVINPSDIEQEGM